MWWWVYGVVWWLQRLAPHHTSIAAAVLHRPLLCYAALCPAVLCRYDEEVCTLHNAAAAGTAAERFLTVSTAAVAAAASSAAVTCLSFRTGGWCGPSTAVVVLYMHQVWGLLGVGC